MHVKLYKEQKQQTTKIYINLPLSMELYNEMK